MAVGLTLVEPLADVDVNVPGVIARLVAPPADQLRVLLAPEFMFVGFAVKLVIAGGEPGPGEELEGATVPQPIRLAEASKSKTSKCTYDLRPPRLTCLLARHLQRSMRPPFGPLRRQV